MSGWTRWAAAAVAALEAHEADRGERLSDDHELGRIEESSGSPSFRIRVGHIRQLAAAPDLAEALEIFADPANWRVGGRCDPNSGNFDGESIARTALLKAKGE